MNQGWRFFECDACGHFWAEPCRDYLTQSSSTCPMVSVAMDAHKHSWMATPYNAIPDPSLPVDSSGNLVKREEPTEGGKHG